MSGKARWAQRLLNLSAVCPLPFLHALGVLLGWLLGRIPNSLRRITAINIERCLPELNAVEQRQLIRQSLIHDAKTVLEMGPVWCWSASRTLALIQHVSGIDTFDAAVQTQQGVIVLTPHLGAWELTGLYIANRHPLTALYRPSRLGPEFDTRIKNARERSGGCLVPTDARGVKQLLQALRNGQVAGILPDQDPGDEGGIFAPFFGHSANTMVLLSRLAIRFQVPVFLTYAERLPRGRGFHLHFLRLPETLNQEPLEHAVAALNLAIEQAIRQCPAQYLWSYKRFKRQPVGADRIY